MKLGISLSGGGVRAAVFHLGVLSRLSECTRWTDISFLSTVSGGTLCIALVVEHAGMRWPTAEEYRDQVLPEARDILTSVDLEMRLKLGLLNPRWWVSGRARHLSHLLRRHWKIEGKVFQMPDPPRWEICATCYETGKQWRFSKIRMGDYRTHYVVNPDFALADAAAASAALPGAIGPLTVKARQFKWHKFATDGTSPTIPVAPLATKYRLWDGGVYDNLGAEPIIKPGGGLREEVDFVLLSDASRPVTVETRRVQLRRPFYIPPFRLIDIATEQVRSLRIRSAIGLLKQGVLNGAVLRMGTTLEKVLRDTHVAPCSRWGAYQFMPEAEVQQVIEFPTTLRKLSGAEFDTIHKHGYEVAESILYAYGGGLFDRGPARGKLIP